MSHKVDARSPQAGPVGGAMDPPLFSVAIKKDNLQKKVAEVRRYLNQTLPEQGSADISDWENWGDWGNFGNWFEFPDKK